AKPCSLGLSKQKREAVRSIRDGGVADLERERIVRAVEHVAEVDELEPRFLHFLDDEHGIDTAAVLPAAGLHVPSAMVDDAVVAAGLQRAERGSVDRHSVCGREVVVVAK